MVAKRFLAVFFPPAEFMVTTRISTVAKAGKDYSFQTNGKVHGQARLARRLRPRGAGGRRQPGRGRRGRAGADRERRRQGAEDQAAGALHRGDAAVGDGRRRQADRRRRAARGDAGEGPRHAGDARRDHRRADLREVHPPRGPRAGAGRQGLPADDAAARPRRRGPDQARADRQLGVPARRDGEGPPRARDLHAEHRRDGRAHRQEGQGVRPRHDPRRLRDARRCRARTAAASSRRTTAATPASAFRASATAAASRSARSRAGAPFELAEVEAFLRDKRIGPLEGFRSKAGWPFTAELKLVRDDEIDNWKLEFDFGEDAKREGESGEPVDFGGQEASARARRRRATSTSSAPTTSASTRSGRRRRATSRAAR